MASIKRSLSSKVDPSGKAEILLRLSINKDNKQRIKSNIFITATRFRDEMIIKPRSNQKELKELTEIENRLIELERKLIGLCQETDQSKLTKELFIKTVKDFHNPKPIKDDTPSKDFFTVFNEFIDTSTLAVARLNHYRVLCRALKRFEVFKSYLHKRYKITFEIIDEKFLNEFVSFLKEEPELFDKYPDLYEEIPVITRTQRKPKKPLPRGENTITCELKRFRAFLNWAIKKGYTNNYPFAKYTIGSEKYGTPFYLTIEERNLLAEWDFQKRPALAIQRDIFIFQCLTGCRVSDLYSLTPESIINGAIEYIPTKTKGERPEIVRVPLNQQAKELVSKYNTGCGKPLFPFISSQKYNDAIKYMLKLAKIERPVTIIDSVSGEEVKKPICDVASSHMARRTFIGNLYKKVKDPNLVGSLSGHKEGSKAFARYREIDDEIKKELVDML